MEFPMSNAMDRLRPSVLGFLLMAAAIPASAQGQVVVDPALSRNTPPQGSVIERRRPDGSIIRISPPESSAPFSPSRALLDRDFMYLRSTSPNPNEFLYGRWNPRVDVIPARPPYGYTPGYPNYYYGGGFTGFPGYGYGYNPYGYGNAPSVIQREVYVYRESQAPPSGDASTTGDKSAATQRPAGDGFYLGNRSGTNEMLNSALEDIRRSWLNGDHARLAARFSQEGAVKVFPGGKFRYEVAGKDFVGMLQEAMKKIDTRSFTLNPPRLSATRALVTGKHVFLDEQKQRSETYVSYGLERVDGRWMITEVGSSDSIPITSHIK